MKSCIIFAGGDFSADDFKSMKADLIICADGGYSHARKIGIIPDAVIGDFDSYTGEFPENAEILKSPPEKDDTDTMLAVKYAIEKKCDSITLYGAMGGRFDHTFANIQTLIYSYENGCKMTICSPENIITVQGIGTEFYEKYDGWYFSVFSLTEKLHIGSMTGVKYPLENYIINQNFPLGVSNEITAEKAVVSVKNGLALIVRSEM